MKKPLLISIVFIFMHVLSNAQTYTDEINKHRETYKQEFLKDERSPLTKDDLNKLNFYTANINYKVKSMFTRIIDTIGFDMQTHSGVIKKYYVYGKVSFKIKNKAQNLFIYQSDKLRNQEGFEDYLFIPFTDNTNYKETFGGGRYIDMRYKDIQGNFVWLDFNKCYNPYCAYKEGYACPIPPRENDMKIAIPAGEKLFHMEGH